MNPILIIAIGGGLVLLILVVVIIVFFLGERDQIDERLDQLVVQDETSSAIQKDTATPVTDWINKRVEGSSWADRISKDLAQADLKMKAGEYIALMIISSFVTGFIAYIISGSSLLFALIGLVGGLLLPGLYVKRQQGQRLIRFDQQLPDMLNLMVNGLRAGYSTMQAMEAVSKELPSPISDEFRRVVQEMQLGISLDRALDNLLRRIPSPDLDMCATAINVQREVGGNLAEILDSISYTIRERVRIKGEIRVLTTQVLYSGRFLAVIPVILVFVLYLINREYMMEFFNPENGVCGYISLGIAALLIIGGYFAMNKIGEIEF